jgi:hypothetical protein
VEGSLLKGYSLSLSASCLVFHARLKVASTVHQEQSAQSGRSFGVYSYCADLIGGTLARGIKRARGKVIWFRRRKEESVTYLACFRSVLRQAYQIRR